MVMVRTGVKLKITTPTALPLAPRRDAGWRVPYSVNFNSFIYRCRCRCSFRCGGATSTLRSYLINTALCQTNPRNYPIPATALHALPCVFADVAPAFRAFEATFELSLLQLGTHPGKRIEKVMSTCRWRYWRRALSFGTSSDLSWCMFYKVM